MAHQSGSSAFKLAGFLLAICMISAIAESIKIPVPMRDGKTIMTLVSKPAGSGPWPAVLQKGYNIRTSGRDALVKAGYVYVAQGVRKGLDPHGVSGDPRFFADDTDGYDVIEWIAKQSWCNGKVAMFGASYFGATQWIAAANGNPGPPPSLKAINPSAINPDFWDNCYRSKGAMNLSMAALSRAFEPAQATYENYMKLPLIDLDKLVRGSENVLWNEYAGHWHYQSKGLNGEPYWPRIGMKDRYKRIKIPIHIYAGWWDYYVGASLKYYNIMKKEGHTPEIRIQIANKGHGPMWIGESIKWFDRVLKGKNNAMATQKPIRIFVQGVDKDRYYDEWPPKGTQYASYYFSSKNGAKDGELIRQISGNETPTTYSYDPKNPVPSIGGNANHRGVDKTLSNGAVLEAGSFDQRPVEKRQDVLTFTTPALTKDLGVIGPVKIKLFAKTDAKDTDFTAVLCDVFPDGKVMNVTEGIVRARFRESIWHAPKLLTPNKIYYYEIELLPTARVFLKGHKIRVHLSSSRFPLWDRNLNTGNDPHTDTQTKVAHQTIYHDKDRPSQIILPHPAGSVDIRSARASSQSQGTALNVHFRGKACHIELDAKSGKPTSASIYDIQGRRLANLQVSRSAAGQRVAVWDAQMAPNGIYVVKVLHGGSAYSRRIVLAK